MSQTEEEMYCRQEKSYGGSIASNMITVLANEYQVNSCINHGIVI